MKDSQRHALTPEQEALADRVREAREARHWTQKDLAHQARQYTESGTFATNTVGNFERKIQFPQPDKLRAILRALNMEAPNDIDLDDPAEDETADVEPFDTCPRCRRVAWPNDYELTFDILGAYMTNVLRSDAERLEFQRRITAPTRPSSQP